MIVATTAAALLFAPAIAFTIGSRGQPMENRQAASFSGVEEGWHSLSELGRFLNDRLPLRATAVTTDAWIDEQVYGEDPAFGGGSTPRVIEGDDGFLFLADAVDNGCAPFGTPQETAANLARFATIIEGSGRDVVTMVAPDKSSVHLELMPPDFDKRACFVDYTEALWDEMNASVIPGFVDLRHALIAESRSTREPLYLRKDSHWDSAGSLVATEQAVERFAPDLWSDDEIAFAGLGEYTGDLTGLRGRPQLDQAPLFNVTRDDVTPVSTEVIDDIEGGFNRRFINAAPEGRLVEGRTLMLLDSYGLVALPQIVPYFEDLTVMRLIDYQPDRFVELIEAADNVWMMSVERSLGYRLTVEIGSIEFLDQLEATLTPRTDG